MAAGGPGQCGIPALSTTNALRTGADLARTVNALSRTMQARGKHLVLLAADNDAVLKTLGAQGVRQVSAVTVREDQRLLTGRPDALVPLPVDVWLATPAG